MGQRFDSVIAPAVRRIQRGGHSLQPHRVDRTTISDSIVAEIIEGVTRDALVLADITTMANVEGLPVRNAKVLYELGLAHAIRRPEEVVVVRSDSDPLLFDVSGIRVHSYDPDGNPGEAEQRVVTLLSDAFAFGTLGDKWVIENAIASLDPVSIGVLLRIMGLSMGPDFEDLRRLARDSRFLSTIHRLLDLRLVKMNVQTAMSPSNPTPASLDDLSALKMTPTGDEVCQELLERSGVWATFGSVRPDIEAQRQEWLRRRAGHAAV